MRALGYISIGIGAVGLAVYYFMGESAPQFILPLIVVSVIAAIFIILISLVAKMFRSRKKYHCLNLSLIHISEPTRPPSTSRMPSSA